MKKTLALALAAVMSLDLQRGDWDREKGQIICANDLAQYGDQIEVVFCNKVTPRERSQLRGLILHKHSDPGGCVRRCARTLPD